MNKNTTINKIEELIKETLKTSTQSEIIETIVDTLAEFNGQFVDDDEDRAYLFAISATNKILKIQKGMKYEPANT